MANSESRLQKDSNAQAKVSGEIVGLDMDPFLATNAEPHQHYTVGKITTKGTSYWADVYGSDKGKRPTSRWSRRNSNIPIITSSSSDFTMVRRTFQ